MAYTRTQWVEQETPLSAQNMNNIEDGIEELQSTKVDKASGKGLSDQNYTATEKTKLAGIAEGAEVNVQPDWNQTNTSADDYIKNKPGDASSSAAGLMSAADKAKLDGVQAGAQVNPGLATTSANGLMSAADKTKLNNIEAGAQVNRTYTAVTGYPTERAYPGFGGSFSVSQVSQDETGQVTLTRRLVEIPNRVASTSLPGLMSAADKTKLNSVMAMDVVTGSLAASRTIAPNDVAALTFNLPSRRQCLYAAPLSLSFPGHIAISAVMPVFETEGGNAYITGIKVSLTNVGSASIKITAGTDMPILLLG